MKKVCALVVLSLLLLLMATTNASECEKWKSEYMKLAVKVAAYGVTYTKYANGDYSESKFNKKKRKLLNDVDTLKMYINTTESCLGMDDRKARLQSWTETVTDAIVNNSSRATEIAQQIRDDFY